VTPEDREMRTLNRAVLVVKPLLPFLNWLNSVVEKEHILSLDDVRRDETTYLIPESTDEKDSEHLLQLIYTEVFEHELGGWCTEEGLWPANRSYQTFRKWFEVEIHTMVVDISGDEIVMENL
jgi:hypothetical protein